jgi:hypothetical protein
VRKKTDKPVKRRHTTASRSQAAMVHAEQDAWLQWRQGLLRAQERWREWYDLEPGEWRFTFEAELATHHDEHTVPEWAYVYRPAKGEWPAEFEDFLKGCYLDRCRTAPTPAARPQPRLFP